MALTLRAALLALASSSSGLDWRDLALYYDGHIYILISKSLPHLYTGISSIFPLFKESTYFTGWFPLYPAFIRLIGFIVPDARIAALAVSHAASALAVVVFYRLARRFLAHPALASLIFAVWPPTWLLTGSLGFAEPLFVLLFLGAFERFLAEETGKSVFLGSLAVVAQKMGILLLPVLGLTLFWREGKSGLKRLAPYLLCLLPLLFLQGYLYAAFGDPLANVRIQRELVADSFLCFPFQDFLAGLFSPRQIFSGHFWLRKALIASSALFYVLVLAWAWRRRRAGLEPLIAWLGVVLLFYSSVGGVWSFYTFPRFMTLAAPPAILLALATWEKIGKLLGGAAALLLAAAPLILLINVVDILSAVELMRHSFPSGYFEALTAALRGSP